MSFTTNIFGNNVKEETSGNWYLYHKIKDMAGLWQLTDNQCPLHQELVDLFMQFNFLNLFMLAEEYRPH